MTIYDGTKKRYAYRLLNALTRINCRRPTRKYNIEIVAGDVMLLKDILKEYIAFKEGEKTDEY